MTNKQERRAKIQGYISLILAGMPARLPGREVSLSPASARPARRVKAPPALRTRVSELIGAAEMPP